MTTEPFREEMRYEYPLTPESVVLDCGGYEGTFAEEISRRYGCWVHVLEPVKAFYEQTFQRLRAWPKVRVYNFGIGGENDSVQFHIKGSMTGAFTGEGETEQVLLAAPATVLELFGSPIISLLKLNIESAEYDVLEAILARDLETRFQNIQVQWHGGAPNAEDRRNTIMAYLERTHALTWDYDWTWQNWKAKA